MIMLIWVRVIKPHQSNSQYSESDISRYSLLQPSHMSEHRPTGIRWQKLSALIAKRFSLYRPNCYVYKRVRSGDRFPDTDRPRSWHIKFSGGAYVSRWVVKMHIFPTRGRCQASKINVCRANSTVYIPQYIHYAGNTVGEPARDEQEESLKLARDDSCSTLKH